MPNDVVIKVENLSKQYRIGSAQSGYKTFRETLVDAAKAPFQRLSSAFGSITNQTNGTNSTNETDYIWALKDVSFEVKRGEVVGIIGRNGAGKSTLLKILSKITEPTKGRIELRGRVGSLLEVGTGFHPELTGHENVYMYGAILGMDRWEVTRKFDEIVAFAELEKFIETPVKRYSSGMYMRLAFAVAAYLETEILLIDEVLAVGDLEFQRKCLGKMEDMAEGDGRTVLFVSHNMAAVKSYCSRSILLEDGGIGIDGDSKSCIEEYVNKGLSIVQIEDLTPFRKYSIKSSIPAHFQKVKVLHSRMHQGALPFFSSGDDVEIEFDIEVHNPVRDASLTIILSRTTGEKITTIFSGDKSISINLRPPNTIYRCRLKGIPLPIGTYQADIGLNQSSVSKAYDVLLAYPLFRIFEVPQTRGQFPNRPWGAFYWHNIEWERIEL